MKCEKCTIREANIHLTRNRNGVVTEHHLCETCAQEQGVGFNLGSKYFDGLGGVKALAGRSIFDTAGASRLSERLWKKHDMSALRSDLC